MSKVISKVRCYNPSKSDTTSGNINHLYYIARRNMTLTNEKGVPTFGEIDNIDVENAHLKDIAREIAQKSNKRTNIYRGIISLKEEDALGLGFCNQEEWKDLMQRRVYDIGKELGIPPLNVQWVAVVHYKKGNPHLHYMVWDKEQKINSYFIKPKTQCKIQEILTKDIFDDELKKYYQIQDDIKKSFRDEELTLSLKAFDMKNCAGKIAYINIPEKTMKELSKLFSEIKNKLPKKGRINYQLMPSEVKTKIDKFMEIFVENNIDMKNEYDKYIENAGNIGSLYGKKSKEFYENKSKQELKRILGNQLLNSMKKIKQEDYQKKIIIKNTMQDVFRFLSALNQSNSARFELNTYRPELSAQAKKEYAIKKANASSIDWENEM